MKTRFDIQYVRNNPAEFDARLALRGLEPMSEEILNRDEQRRQFVHQSETQRAEARALQKEIGKAKKTGQGADLLIQKATAYNDHADMFAEHAAQAEASLEALLAQIPNLPLADVPQGLVERSNVEVHRWGSPRLLNGLAHDELKFHFGFEAASRMSGARFAMLKGPVAKLHRVIGQFMLDFQGARGYSEVAPPMLVRRETMFGTGQLPKFEMDLFQTLAEEDADHMFLIPTAEVSLTNYVREQILPADSFPMRFVALTPCFRAEAGAAGRDTRGLIRQHQFDKVELVSIATADTWEEEHDYMLRSAELVLENLELPYRRVLLCAGDMGFSAQKTYDLEVWMPGQETYREISSVSYCGEFQARRMNARYKDGSGSHFLHTLNGSGLAVGRTLAAVMENYQLDESSIAIPAVLRPYFGGREVLRGRE